MSVEPSRFNPSSPRPGRALSYEFVRRRIYESAMSVDRDKEELTWDIYDLTQNILGNIDNGPFKSDDAYTANLGVLISHASKVTMLEGQNGAVVHKKEQELDVRGLNTIVTMMGAAAYARVVIIQRAPIDAPPYVMLDSEPTEGEIALYCDREDTPEAVYVYEFHKGTIEVGARGVVQGEDLIQALAITEMVLGQPQDRVWSVLPKEAV